MNKYVYVGDQTHAHIPRPEQPQEVTVFQRGVAQAVDEATEHVLARHHDFKRQTPAKD